MSKTNLRILLIIQLLSSSARCWGGIYLAKGAWKRASIHWALCVKCICSCCDENNSSAHIDELISCRTESKGEKPAATTAQ